MVANSEVQSEDVISTSSGFPGPLGPVDGPLITVYTNSLLTNLALCASNSGSYESFELIYDPTTGDFYPQQEWYVFRSFSFPVAAGQTYQISCDGVNGTFGSASVGFTFIPPPSPPSNDNFAQRIPLTGVRPSVYGTTVAATRELREPLHGADSNARTVWYSWIAPSSGDAQVSAYNFSWNVPGNVEVAVYTGSSLSTLTPVAIGSSSEQFYAVAGRNYQIAVVGTNGLGVNFWLVFDNAPPLPPQLASSQSTILKDHSFQVSATGATGQSFVIQASSDLKNW
jgi:hypothetical protein